MRNKKILIKLIGGRFPIRGRTLGQLYNSGGPVGPGHLPQEQS